jgi:tRNA-2-methylthio-N6-dimethylallyladenosine synthase
VELQREIGGARNREYVGQILSVLVEREATRSPGRWMGKTDGNIAVIWDKALEPLQPGRLTHRRITDSSVAALFAE